MVETIEQLKKKLLRLLEEDREFRYAVMGLLGFREILERQQRLEERYQKLEERFAKLEERFASLEKEFHRLEERFAKLEAEYQRLEERFARLEDRVVKLEERFAQLEEKFAKLEERVLRLEERFAQLEERFAKLEERVIKLEERFARLEEEMRETRRVVAVIAHRFGLLSEQGLREALKYVVEEVLGTAKVEKITLRDEEGIVYGHPSLVDVDVVVRDKEHIIVEIKSKVSRGDVAEVYRIGLLYQKVKKIRPRLLIIGGFIDKDAYELAKRLGVEVRPVIREVF